MFHKGADSMNYRNIGVGTNHLNLAMAAPQPHIPIQLYPGIGFMYLVQHLVGTAGWL
eukprot:SAG31_NODE_6585_length_1962_cov_2.600107_1_plen_57_part_00